ncbi:MAG: maoC like domain protein [Amycolatopsis sp.]|jgi:acyl dehydratase|uniref:MaoC family dehydratase n=1 Tax=Amycolatopsis sp. TaxID=37632 RepID=UPI002637301C|nr:MaoC family dehydratase [Amycolatopsis sp.]MCU1683935.1 maoC like domain protein [Amycolatopsis sp.]
MAITATDNYFDDFEVGALFEHSRGRTVTEMDNVLLTLMVMNTAQGHFNEEFMAGTKFGKRIVFGGITASMIIGLASQDTAENAIAELKLDKVRFSTPVFHGDTLYAFTEVLDAWPDGIRADAGIVRFRHYGVNQRDQVVFEGERTVLIKRRLHEVETPST